MTQAAVRISQLMTMDDYLAYEGEPEVLCELVNGELVEMPTESQRNLDIAKYLMFELAKYLPLALLALATEIEVSGSRATCRVPDLVVHSPESREALQGARRAVVLRDMPPPAVVIEVVSPGQENRDRDYRHKRTEYAAREIAEYWIVDPSAEKVTVCAWVNGAYEDVVYSGDDRLRSAVVEGFDLTVEQILAFGDFQ